MGICFTSAVTRVTGSASATAPADTPKPREDKPSPPRHRRRPSGLVPCGKRTDFGFGKDFEDRYAIGKLLGHGQFGYTFVATDRATGDRVAVKRIDKKKMILPIAVEDVKREVKILQALKGHENVVHFYNAFEDDSYVYIVMEHYSFIQERMFLPFIMIIKVSGRRLVRSKREVY